MSCCTSVLPYWSGLSDTLKPVGAVWGSLAPAFRVYPLRDVAEIFTGYLPPKGESTRGGQGTPFGFIQIGDIQDGVLSWELETIEVTDAKRARKSLVEANDVLLTSRGTLVKSSVVPKGYPEAIISSNLLGIRPRPGLRSAVLAAYFSTRAGQEAVLSLSTQTTMRLAVTSTALGDLEVVVPDDDTQFRIEQLVTATTQYVRATREVMTLRQQVADASVEEYLDPARVREAP